jgi:predicted HD superfamily hydrolase involved in NAD metabolism
MDIIRIKDDLKDILKPSRYQHSTGVESVAKDLAVINGYDMEKAGLAGILHDCAKYLPDTGLLAECIKYKLPVTDTERKCVHLLHAKVGALYARIKYEINDEEILNAITFHTTGRPAMTMLEKIIFTADYIEPYRKPLPRIDIIREASYDNLDLGVYMVLENMVNYLESTAEVIDTMTIDTYEYYKGLLTLKD